MKPSVRIALAVAVLPLPWLSVAPTAQEAAPAQVVVPTDTALQFCKTKSCGCPSSCTTAPSEMR